MACGVAERHGRAAVSGSIKKDESKSSGICAVSSLLEQLDA